MIANLKHTGMFFLLVLCKCTQVVQPQQRFSSTHPVFCSIRSPPAFKDEPIGCDLFHQKTKRQSCFFKRKRRISVLQNLKSRKSLPPRFGFPFYPLINVLVLCVESRLNHDHSQYCSGLILSERDACFYFLTEAHNIPVVLK